MNNFFLVLLFSGVTCFQSVFASEDTVLFDIGYVEENVYYNDFFDFEFEIPDTWDYKLDKEQKILKRAIKEVYSDDNELRHYIDPADVELAFLLLMTKKYVYGDKYTTSIILLVERIDAESTFTGAQYLDAAARGLKISNPKAKISKDPYTKQQFGGKTFYGLFTKSKVGNVKVNQTFYATIIGDFAFIDRKSVV